MKRHGGLWPRVIAFDNLLDAFRRARAGKRARPDVLAFEMNMESELLALQRELAHGSYTPGAYRLFTLYERKPRAIAAAPFRDRVVHHALMNVVEPLLDRSFIHHSYACRVGGGVHRAVAYYRRRARTATYALKMDIASYFPSVDHELVKHELRRRLKDRAALALFEAIIDGAPPGEPRLEYFPGDDLFTPIERRTGIPIGNLTSQFLANLYLDRFDHFMEARSGIRGYLRYVDDMVVLADDKGLLWDIRDRAAHFLESLRLRLHPNKVHVFRVVDGIDLLGYRVWPDRVLIRNDNGHRFSRRLRTLARLYAEGRLRLDGVDSRIQSWIGHAAHADTHALRRRIFHGVVFSRG